MDNLTHGLVGAALARAGLDRLTPLGTTTLVVAANAPDVDMLAFLEGEYAALAFRRGLTHGFPAMAVLPFAVTTAVLAWDRGVRRRRDPGTAPARAGPVLLLSVLGLLTHPILDWMNTYGMRWWVPFDGSWSYGDSLFIIDPWLWLGLGGAVALTGGRTRGAALGWGTLAAAATALVLSAPIPPASRAVWLAGVSALVVGWYIRARRGRRARDLRRPEDRNRPEERHLPEDLRRPEDRNLPEDRRRPEHRSYPEDRRYPEDLRRPEDRHRPEERHLPEDRRRPEHRGRGGAGHRRGGSAGARRALVAATAYVALMVLGGRVARSRVLAEARAAGIGPVEAVMVAPLPADPLGGDVVVRTATAYVRGSHRWLRSPPVRLGVDSARAVLARGPGVDSTRAAAAREAAWNAPPAADFRVWSRLPRVRVDTADGGFRVRIADMRYEGRGAGTLEGLTVRLDGGFRVMGAGPPRGP